MYLADCHTRLSPDSPAAPADVGAGLPRAAELLREYGFSLAVYERRRPRLIPL